MAYIIAICGLRISASFIHIYLSVPSPGATASVQNGVSGSYMDAVELVVNEKSESWTSLPHSFTKEGLLQLPG